MTVADHRKRLMRAYRGGMLDRQVLFSKDLIMSDKVIAHAPARTARNSEEALDSFSFFTDKVSRGRD